MIDDFFARENPDCDRGARRIKQIPTISITDIRVTFFQALLTQVYKLGKIEHNSIILQLNENKNIILNKTNFP